jgi:hypothetical protein
VKSSTRFRPWLPPKAAFAGFRFPAEVIMVAVRWYLRYNLSYRDIEELGLPRVWLTPDLRRWHLRWKEVDRAEGFSRRVPP